MEAQVDRLFKNLLVSKNPLGLLSESVWKPPADVYETPDEIIICMEISSIRRQDVSISLLEDILTVRGRRRDTCRKQKVRYHQMEIHYGCFERSFVLPANIDRRGIQPATYDEGFLRITIPKLAQPVAGPTSINVRIKL